MISHKTVNEYCREKFGHKLYKLSLDGGMTCPNRDGSVGFGGCIFCSETGSGEFSEKQCGNIFEQIERAKLRVASKNKSGKYIAYFQNYTNTYAPVDYLEGIFTEAINHPDIEVLSIATRPDCLGDGVIALLEKINKIKPVWVELGFQSSKAETVKYINRGYENVVFQKAVNSLHAVGVQVIAHVILGLPMETEEDMKNTVKYVCDCGIDGIKLHLLYVVKGTRLAEDYEKGKFSCLTKNEYLSLVCNMLEIIPSVVIIHRLTGDGDKKTLIAPLWSANKKDVLNSLSKMIEQRKL